MRHARQKRAVVSLPVYEVSLALAPELVRENDDRVADRRIAVRVVLHRLADDVRDLSVPPVVLLVERVHDSALHRLQAVLHGRYRARADDVRRVLAEVEVVEVAHRAVSCKPGLRSVNRHNLGLGLRALLRLRLRGRIFPLRRLFGLLRRRLFVLRRGRLRFLVEIHALEQVHVVEHARRLLVVFLCHLRLYSV